MSRRKQRVPSDLDTRGIDPPGDDEIRAVLRAADELIRKGGRSLLTKVLRGSSEKRVLELGLHTCPAYGFYRDMSEERVLATIDWTIIDRYLEVIYDGRLPVLVFTDLGWAIERETYANELLDSFDRMLAAGNSEYDMSYLKDRDRGMILLLLDKVEATGDPKYIPLLEAWAEVDYKKVRDRIGSVLRALGGAATPAPGR